LQEDSIKGLAIMLLYSLQPAMVGVQSIMVQEDGRAVLDEGISVGQAEQLL
jgi:hypothetical protein